MVENILYVMLCLMFVFWILVIILNKGELMEINYFEYCVNLGCIVNFEGDLILGGLFFVYIV